MKNKLFLCLATVSLLFLWGCSSNKLNKTVWYNVTMMQENGVVGNVGTTLFFNSDSTFIAYKGVSLDSTVILPPFIYVCGEYRCEKTKGKDISIYLNGTTKDGNGYQYSGQYNKKKGIMIFDFPNSNMKETYLWNPKAKVVTKK